MPITSFDGPLLGFNKSRRRGKDEKKARKGKDEKEDKTLKREKPPHQVCVFFWVILLYNWENWNFEPFLAHCMRLWPYMYICLYIYIYAFLQASLLPTFSSWNKLFVLCRGKRFSENENAFLARFLVHCFWAMCYYKIGEIWKCLAKLQPTNRSNAVYFYLFLPPLCFFFLHSSGTLYVSLSVSASVPSLSLSLPLSLSLSLDCLLCL